MASALTPPKKNTWRVLQILVVLLLGGCRPALTVTEITTQVHPVQPGQRIEIELDTGRVELRGEPGNSIEIGGRASEPDAIQIEANQVSILITSDQMANMDHQLLVNVPTESYVTIQIGSGSLFVHDLQGKLWIETISAPIRVEQFEGDLLARTRRGSIKISDSQGNLDAIAEADDIEFRAVSGQVTGTNIMGEIHFESLLSNHDTVRLETDHGAVRVALRQGSDSAIELITASGMIVCTLPGKSGTGDQCEGSYGGSQGELWIRTVSGPIRIESLD